MRNGEKSRPLRTALREVSNNNAGVGRSSAAAKKIDKEPQRPSVEQKKQDDRNDDALDRLLLVQSDLSALVSQIDELVVEAFKCKAGASKEVEAFTHFLSEMHSTLKPWVPQLKKAFSNPVEALVVDKVDSGGIKSPEVVSKGIGCPASDLDSMISPSPLVSWRADCTIQRGRQVFTLTPLPISKSLSSKPPMPSKPSVFKRLPSFTTDRPPFFRTTGGDTKGDWTDFVGTVSTLSNPSDSVATETGVADDSGFVSPLMSKGGCSMVLDLKTPCLRSPPKSCVLLEPFSESNRKGHHLVCNRKSTPFPVGVSNFSDSDSETSEDLAFSYPESQHGYKSGIENKDVEDSPDWYTKMSSPPKTCVLLNPYDESSSDKDSQLNLPLPKEIKGVGGIQQIKTSLQEPVDGRRFAMIESTPVCKQAGSAAVRTGKQPGENTLKRELWTKFEAASTNELTFDDLVPQKRLLDPLDEASS